MHSLFEINRSCQIGSGRYYQDTAAFLCRQINDLLDLKEPHY